MHKALVNKVKWQQDDSGHWVCFNVDSHDAERIISGMKDGRQYEVTVKEYRKTRSNDANAYFWTLVGALSAALRASPDEIYRQYIPDVGGNYEVVPVREDRIKEWNRIWCGDHMGRLTEDLGECKHAKGYHNIRCYIGSSDYDTVQMSRLIELVIEDCKAQGIETITEKERLAMLKEWADAHEVNYG